MDMLAPFLKQHLRRTLACAACVFLCWVAYSAFHNIQHDMRITFLDVGQGDAVLITAPNGNRLLYDAGPPTRAVLAELSKESSSYDGHIAFMVASHPDADHIGSFVEVLKHYKPMLYLDAHTPVQSADFAAVETALGEEHLERRTVGRGTRIGLGSGVFIDVLDPLQDERKQSLSSNDASVVLRVQYGSSTILLTGDLEADEESRLVDGYGTALHATILKAGHHGSKSSSSERFLFAVDPQYIAISVGKNNKYGHPSSAAIDRMQRTHAQILETAALGSIHFSCSLVTCVYDPL